MSALMYKNNQFKQRYRNQNQRYGDQYGNKIISKVKTKKILFCHSEARSLTMTINLVLYMLMNKLARELIGSENVV